MKITVSEIQGDHMPMDGAAPVTVHTRAGNGTGDVHIIGDSPRALRQLAELLTRCADAFEQPFVADAAE